mmetsp:Transcript_34142/g.98452  ORF Transcript_34142/g.98452 Transcript_34142/m.98452 type:complete len:273 (-) Transcript_34142:78-896(-)|eukprot:CAMPEP_0176065620 /NCGR_PEP_ID=MMETSP0120_2-20121206/32741_1 /TAXON_ID=160619 /ORGANISM="Kryptoperidinium foliaceum, Strain CCMP 1326" /LENGTH=272 /DNA_ID=CAMNT_0017399215 /DNA_START=101 /DNA_END=919 /DNA_ORIENTATION=+
MSKAKQQTVVLRNIACSLSPAMVKSILDDAGLGGAFSYVCVPCIPSGRSNFGYAFVGFRSAADAEECCRLFDGKTFGRTSSKKVCQVELANEEKDSRALAQMNRRQRHGRQLGLLVCDGSGKHRTSAERATSSRLGTAVGPSTHEVPPLPASSAGTAPADDARGDLRSSLEGLVAQYLSAVELARPPKLAPAGMAGAPDLPTYRLGQQLRPLDAVAAPGAWPHGEPVWIASLGDALGVCCLAGEVASSSGPSRDECPELYHSSAEWSRVSSS